MQLSCLLFALFCYLFIFCGILFAFVLIVKLINLISPAKMKDLITILKDCLMKLPPWAKISCSILLAIVVAVLAFFSLTSCGSFTKATIRGVAETASTTVTITTNNPTNITTDASPNVNALFHPKDTLK